MRLHEERFGLLPTVQTGFSPEHQCPNMFQLNTKRCNSKQTNKDRSRMGCCVLGDRDAVPRSGVYTLSGSHMK